MPISFASFIACFLNSSSYCFPVPIDDTLLCFYYTLIVLYVSSFIIQDYSLGGWDQRPVFKANIKTFVSLRRNSPPIEITELRRIIEIFPTPYDEFALDPTYEPDKHESDIKEINREHEAVFKTLQKYVKLNLVIPVGAEHMYYAAINHKSCKLTAQGQHYWNLVRKNII